MKPKNLQVHFRTTLQIATSCLVVVSVRFSHIYEILQPLENRGLVGSQCLNCTKKKHTLNVNACVEFRNQNEHFRLERYYQPKKCCFSWNSIFGLQTRRPNRKLSFPLWNSTQALTLSVCFFGTIQTLGIPPTLDFQEVEDFHIYAKNVVRRPLSKIVAVCSAFQKWTWWFLGVRNKL